MSLRFGSAVRLHSRREFLAVQEQGRRISGRYLTMLALPNSRGCYRLGIVASKRIGGAVKRNRAKRRLRDLFRHANPDRQTASKQTGFDLVVIARRQLIDAPHTRLAADFSAALDRVDPGLRA